MAAAGTICPARTWPTPGCSFVVRERIQIGGRVFEPGAPFDYAAHGMIELQAQQWWMTAILDVATTAAPPPPPKLPQQPQRPQHRR